MIKMGDLNIPITIDCNLHCKYCFRDSFEKPKKLPDLSDAMIEFLKNHSNGIVTLTGGEPLLHFDKVQEIFSYVPKSIPKSIITNGTLLTPEIVKFINDNEIEILLSHDGVGTKLLRGVDVLENKTICKLLREVKKFRVSSVATKYNADVWENFFYIAKKLGFINFGYASGPLMDIEQTRYLVDGFDYDTYVETLFQYIKSPYYMGPCHAKSSKTQDYKVVGFSVLLDGTICGNINVSAHYGTIFDNLKDCKDRAIQMGDINYCVNTKCKHNDHCRFLPQGASNHSCKCRQMIMDRGRSPEYLKKVSEYVENHLGEIEKKYGWDSSYLL